ncbi:MAG: hypothetical protein AB7F78_23730 [Hyphomicrobiaceae bacterium]
MATVFFVRDGTGPERMNGGREVLPATLDAACPSARVVWFDAPPTFTDAHPANPVADFRHVVLRVEPHETQGRFNKSGYWVLNGVRPTDIVPLLA